MRSRTVKKCVACCMLAFITVVAVGIFGNYDITLSWKSEPGWQKQLDGPASSNSSVVGQLSVTDVADDGGRHPDASQPYKKLDDGSWFNFSVPPTFLFYVYSAFYDNRISAAGLGNKRGEEDVSTAAVIRIIAISTTVEDLQRRNVSLDCLVHYNPVVATGRSTRRKFYRSSVLATAPSPIGAGYPLNGVGVKEYVYCCPLPHSDSADLDKLLPSGVSIISSASAVSFDRISNQIETTNASGSSLDNEHVVVVPVEKPSTRSASGNERRHRLSQPLQQQQLAVCVQIIYGHRLDALRLIEWFELLRLLGVSLIGLYLAPNVSGPAVDVLLHYNNSSSRLDDDGLILELRRSDYIGPVGGGRPPSADQYLLLGSPVINDCIYRHMYSHQRIAIIDIDEVILPRYQWTIMEMITKLDQARGSPAAAYVFRNQYFFMDLPPDDQETSNYTIVRYRRKVALSPPGYSVKSIIDPLLCVNMHNHYCWGFNQPTARSVDVEPTIAVSHHYKYCHFSSIECLRILNSSTVDHTIARYRDQLVERVDRKRAAIFGR